MSHDGSGPAQLASPVEPKNSRSTPGQLPLDLGRQKQLKATRLTRSQNSPVDHQHSQVVVLRAECLRIDLAWSGVDDVQRLRRPPCPRLHQPVPRGPHRCGGGRVDTDVRSIHASGRDPSAAHARGQSGRQPPCGGRRADVHPIEAGTVDLGDGAGRPADWLRPHSDPRSRLNNTGQFSRNSDYRYSS